MTYAIKKGLIKPAKSDVLLPKDVWWLTFTRSSEDLLTEVTMSFERDLYDLFRENVKFKDFSEDYFRTSPARASGETKLQISLIQVVLIHGMISYLRLQRPRSVRLPPSDSNDDLKQIHADDGQDNSRK